MMQSFSSSERRRRSVLWLCALLAAGTALRVKGLDPSPLWVDKAESSINALTILSEGLLLNHHLGTRTLENTLVRPCRRAPSTNSKASATRVRD